jgi:uncharacterized protein (TIGR03083 family)
MKSDDIGRVLDEQRADLADLLDTLDAGHWSAPSLCADWSVRDVAVHLTHAHASRTEMLYAAIRAGFRFDAMVSRMAVRDTADPLAIVIRLRAMAGLRRRPPMTTEVDPLMDVLVHGQDICVPLGIDRPMPADAAAAVAERLWHMRFPLNPRRRLPGIRFVATDTEFGRGNGPALEAPIRDIVMVLAGRPAAISAEVNRRVAAGRA